MSVRILYDPDNGACMYCSTTMRAFGPIFDDGETADDFLDFCRVDPRLLSDAELSEKYAEFLANRMEQD